MSIIFVDSWRVANKLRGNVSERHALLATRNGFQQIIMINSGKCSRSTFTNLYNVRSNFYKCTLLKIDERLKKRGRLFGFFVLHHGVVIRFWSSGIMDFMLFTFKYSSSYPLGGVSGVAYFINTDKQLQYNRGCYFPKQAMLPEGFLFSQFS